MEKFESIHDKKLEFLDKRENALKRRVGAAERQLLDVIIEKFVDELEISDGKVVSNGKNIKLTQALNRVFEEFDRIVQGGLIDGYINDISSIKAFNSDYFGEFESNKSRLEKIKNGSSLQVNRRLGIDGKGKTVRGGFLDNFIKDTRLKNEFTELVTKGISGGSNFKDLKSEIKTFIVGNKDKVGGLESQYSTFIYDTFQQIDRFESGIYAKEIGMEAFIYAGGKISGTRKFCCQRNGKIWTTEEAESWSSLKFQGKSKNYNPLVDLGGYNCRHSTQYISNLIAARRRDDLKLDENGKLVVDKKGNKQNLNKC